MHLPRLMAQIGGAADGGKKFNQNRKGLQE